MDNAQKAIMIGVGLFITIIIISAVLLITNIGTNLVNNAQSQMSGISTSLQNQVTASFDGKVMTGAEVIAAVQQYENSNNLSVRIIVTGTASAKQFETGKYGVKIDATQLEALTKPIAGGILVNPADGTSYDEATKSTLTDIQATGGVSATQTYNSYVMKDENSQTVMGICFVRVGIDSTELKVVPGNI
ncbi:MAG: hypothetical protein IKV94_04985 [Clostridia bacterium]|nr:hypothetical protein [Clostridia bacterium]